LSDSQSSLDCQDCHTRYQNHHGIPELVHPDFLNDFKREEQHFHDELSSSVRRGSVQHRNSEFHWHFKRPMMDLPRGSAVLEVACGTRADGIEIALTGKSVSALDISPDAVAHSRRLSETSGASDYMRFLVADGEHLPFADRSFDATFIAASFHHLPDQLGALREMARVTKPGGYVILGVEPAAWPYRTVYRWLAPVKHYIRRHRHREHNSVADDSTEGYTEPQIRKLITDAGLEFVDLRRVKFLSELYDSGVRMIGRLVRRPYQSHPTVDHILARIDQALGRIPGVDKIFWHYSLIATVPPHQS